MRQILKGEFQNIRTLPGYRNISHICSEIYEEFKQKCAEGKQPGTFADFYSVHGITWEQMHGYLKRNKLKVRQRPQRPINHTKPLIFIDNMTCYAQNKKSTPFHKEVDGNLNLNLIL